MVPIHFWHLKEEHFSWSKIDRVRIFSEGYQRYLAIEVTSCVRYGGLKIEKITFLNRLIVIIVVYHIGFRKKNVIFDFEGF